MRQQIRHNRTAGNKPKPISAERSAERKQKMEDNRAKRKANYENFKEKFKD